MKVNIVGAGYVGLVTGIILASEGHRVRLFERDIEKIEAIATKKIPFYEKGLKKLLLKTTKNKKFSIHEFKLENFDEPDIFLICVGTPTVNNNISLTNLLNVGEVIGNWLKSYKNFCSIVIKSTVLAGTTDTFFKNLIENKSNLDHGKGDFGLGMNPEFLREGNAVNDFMYPDRIVIGYEDMKTRNRLTKLYSSFKCKKIYTNSRTAEMSKYANNALLALQISAVNELSNISHAMKGTDFSRIIEIVKTDHRWNNLNDDNSSSILNYLIPGPGFGGSCFPKDLKALSSQSSNLGINSLVLNAVINTNNKQPENCVNLLLKKMSFVTVSKKILFLGLTFKPETDDLRESTSIKMIHSALNKGCIVKFHDPFFSTYKLKHSSDDSEFVKDWGSYIQWSDAIVIATAHKEYKKLLLLNIDDKKIIFDPRRFFFKKEITLKENYFSLG